MLAWRSAEALGTKEAHGYVDGEGDEEVAGGLREDHHEVPNPVRDVLHEERSGQLNRHCRQDIRQQDGLKWYENFNKAPNKEFPLYSYSRGQRFAGSSRAAV